MITRYLADIGMTSAACAIATQALCNEAVADGFQARGFHTHAQGTRRDADRLWTAAFAHIPADPDWIYAEARSVRRVSK